MQCREVDGLRTEVECLAAFEYFRWADSHHSAVAAARPDQIREQLRGGQFVRTRRPPLRRRHYRCRRCHCKDYYRCSKDPARWEYYIRKCRKCGVEISLTSGTAFEGMRLRRELRMSI